MAGSSIAILPFVNLSQGSEAEYFGDGLAEEIINALTRIDGLQVTARTSSFAFKGQAMDIREIGRQLDVANVLEGSIRMVGSRVRITAQLINVEDGYHLWSESFDRLIDDIFAVQDEISLLLADKIREYSAHFEIADQLVPVPNVSTAVYQQFLRGRHLVQNFNIVDVQRGIDILEKLTQEHPQFGQPFLTLTFAYTFMGGFGVMPSKQAFDLARQYLDQVPAAERSTPEYLLRLAGLSYWCDWEISEAFEYLQRALQQQPGNAEVHLWMSVCLATMGQFRTALQHIDNALKLDPFSPLHHDFKGMIYYFAEEYELAIDSFRRCLNYDPNFHMSHINLAAAELMRGNLEAGLKKFQNLPPSGAHDMSILGGEILAKAVMGHTEEVQEGIARLEAARDAPVADRVHFFLILIYTTLGDYERALDFLEEAVRRRMSILIALDIEPFLKNLRQHPRFRRIMQVVKKEDSHDSLQDNPKPSAVSKADMQQLEQLMQEQAPYLDPQLSLRKLATLAGHHPNYLSRLINECTGHNFAEYTNAYRLKAFAQKAKDPAARKLTLLAVAYECGFNSKTVFNTFCKKMTGQTPSAYWKSSIA